MAVDWQTPKKLEIQYIELGNKAQMDEMDARQRAADAPEGPDREAHLETAEQMKAVKERYFEQANEQKQEYFKAHAEMVEEMKREREQRDKDRGHDGPDEPSHSY